jgi:hypothetical protein
LSDSHWRDRQAVDLERPAGLAYEPSLSHAAARRTEIQHNSPGLTCVSHDIDGISDSPQIENRRPGRDQAEVYCLNHRAGIGINRWSSIDEDPGPLGGRNGFAGVGGWAGDQLGQHGLTTAPPAGCRSLSIYVHDQGITCSGREMQG